MKLGKMHATPNGAYRAAGWAEFNMTDGGEGTPGYKYTEEQLEACIRAKWIVPQDVREKMRQAKLGKSSHRKGIKVTSEETLKKMSESARGRKCSDESKTKRRAASTGRKHTEESKAKIREARAKQIFSAETKAKMSCSRKGTEPWNKGKQVMTPEQKEHLSQIQLGKQLTDEHKAKVSKGLKASYRDAPRDPTTQETRDKISATLTGNTPWNKGVELSDMHCKALSLSHKGKKQSPQTIAKREATKARKRESLLILNAMGPPPTEVHLDG